MRKQTSEPVYMRLVWDIGPPWDFVPLADDSSLAVYMTMWQHLHRVGLRFRFWAKSRYELKCFAFTWAISVQSEIAQILLRTQILDLLRAMIIYCYRNLWRPFNRGGADNSLHMSTCGLHLSLQIGDHHNSNSCREWKWATGEQFLSCLILDHNLHCLVLFCYYFLKILLQFYHFTLPCYWHYSLLRDWQHNEEQLRQTIFNQNKAIARYNRNTIQLGPQLTVGKSQG